MLSVHHQFIVIQILARFPVNLFVRTGQITQTLRAFTERCIPSRTPKGGQSSEVPRLLLYILSQQGRYSRTSLSKLI